MFRALRSLLTTYRSSSCFPVGNVGGLTPKLVLMQARSGARASRYALQLRGECQVAEVIWLLRRLKPDFKTIADFRRDNQKAFRAVFRDFVRLCRELDPYGRALIAVDGTGIKAVNSADRNFTKAGLRKDLELIDRRLERYL